MEESNRAEPKEQGIFCLSGPKGPLITRISESSLKKIKTGSKVSRRHWGTFCKSTSIHGLRYLAEPTKSHLDKVWWVLVVTIGLGAASYYVSRQWVKWNQTPIDADNEENREPRHLTPFPAVTICDNRKLNSTLDPVARSEDKNLMYLICGDDRLETFNYTEEHLFTLIPPLIMNCTLARMQTGTDVPTTSRCDKMFTRTLTDQGVCYTFNMLNPKEIFKDGVKHGHSFHDRNTDWHMLTGYSAEALKYDDNGTDALNTGPFPKRSDNALMIRLYHENNVNPQYCYGDTDGYRVILHNPDEFPMIGNRESPWIAIEKKTRDDFLVLPAYKKSHLDFKTRRKVPADKLESYYYKQRKCYFPGEKTLSYFKIYSYNNCQLECLTNSTKDICGCIDYYMPRMVLPGEPENVTKVCTGRIYLMCVIHAFDLWDRNRHQCQCLPSCTTLSYDISAWYSSRDYDVAKPEGIYSGLLVTEIIVYSTDDEYVKSERRAMYTRVDFIADCGGVFGLFCGMSIISLVEFIYYGFLWVIGRVDDTDEQKNKKTTNRE